jgi:hypothetical protein
MFHGHSFKKTGLPTDKENSRKGKNSVALSQILV